MKLLALLFGASAVAAKITPRECRDDFLFFNKTNVADMADCGRLSYKCTNESFIFFDTAGGLAPPSDCTTKAKFHLYFEDVDLTGPVSLPGVVHATSITAKGGWWARENITTAEINAMRDNPNPSEAELLNWTGGKGLQLLNISRLDLPDLVNISSGGIVMYDVGNLSSLTVPKLKYIAGPITLKLSHGPAISLSFPELYQVTRGIFISGKIDALDFPVLNSSLRINVTTTGDLDCVAFAKSVVNTTEWPVVSTDFPVSNTYRNSSVICNSNKARVTMHPVPPPEESTEESTEKSTGSRSGLGFGGNLMLLAILVVGASWFI